MMVFSLGRRPGYQFVLHYSPDSGMLAATTPTAGFRSRDVWQWELADGTERRSEQRYSYRWDSTVLTFDAVVLGTKVNLPTFRFPTKAGCSTAGFRRYCKALSAPVYASLIRYNGLPTKTSRRGFSFTALVRDATNPRRRRTIEWVADSYHMGLLGLSADGGRVAAQVGHAIRVWNKTTGEQLGEVRPKRQQPRAFAFSADGRYLGVLFQDSVSLYDTTSWAVARTYAWKIGKLLSLAFSPDGATAAVGSDTGKVVVFDLD